MMRLATLKAALAGLAAVALASWAGPASAENDGGPTHGACFTCGLATGYLPPPGIYFVDWSVYAAVSSYSVPGVPDRALGADAAVNVPLFQWVPDLKLGPAGVSVLVIPAIFKMVDVYAGGSTVARAYGNVGTYFQFDASYPLGGGFAIDGHFGVQTPWGASTSGVNLNDRYAFQPGIAISYLANGWNLTLWTNIEFATQGTVAHATPGDYLESEWSVVKDIGWLGVGGVFTANTNITNDTGPGAGNSYEVAIGPYIQKAFGPAEWQVYWTHDVACQNLLCGDVVWLRFVAKLM
jgi:hypothetical protein